MSVYALVGGAGFIGSHFVDELIRIGEKVIVVDNLSSGTESRISNHLSNESFKFINQSAEDTELLTYNLNGVDKVIHLASNADIAKAELEPRIDFISGTALTESVIEACRRAGVNTILYASGSGVYREDPNSRISESHDLQPISTYGASKLAGEALVSAYSYMFGIKGIAFRFANVVGPRQTHGVGFDFLRKLEQDSTRLEVLGNGTQTKSYIHVHDVVQAVLFADKMTKSGYDVFNVATLETISVKEIASLAIKAKGLNAVTTKIMFGQLDRGWKADVPKIFLDSSKLRRLGWSNSYSTYEAIIDSLK